MFDVFYSGTKPNLFVHERAALDIAHAKLLSRTRYFWWITYLADYTGWDFLWEPVPWEQNYTHTWPSQWHDYSGTYLVPKNTSTIEYRFHKKIIASRASPENYNVLVENVDFDWSWHPHPLDPPYNYVFGNQWWPANRMATIQYPMPGSTETKYIFTPHAWLPDQRSTKWHTLQKCEFDYSWCPDPGDPPYIYVFGNQWHRGEIMPTVEYHALNAIEKKYLPYPRAKLLEDTTLWTVPDTIDPASVDYTWVPDPSSPPYIYQFGTQHQRTGGPQYHVPGATETKYITQLKIKTESVANAIYEIDHLDGNGGKIKNSVKTVRYFDNYLDTLIRLAKNIPSEHEFVWICSSVCDYTDFDFSWHPEQWQAAMLHVFPSNGEKFGDTFFMHVPTFQYRAEKCQLLEWYDLNFTDINVSRRPLPVVQHTFDSHVEAVKTIDWAGPLAVFCVTGLPEQVPPVPLWREKTKTIVPLSAGASQVIVPKTAVPYIKTQAYDYPYIDRTQRHLHQDQLLDIVFIDNGESNADDNWNSLLQIAAQGKNMIHRSSGINGRVVAYQAAARLSTTPWFFAVFAKLRVALDFDWAWHPDRLQQPKHYIFHAFNPVNGLTYGHQALIAYNKKLVLGNAGVGLDFTLDSEHEVVPILSGTAEYAHTQWSAWRTAFRECIKLRHSLPDVENEYRLGQWCNNGHGVNAKWSTWGAQDAVEYYDSVNGNFFELRKSYDWAWLASYAFQKRNLTPDQ